MLTALRALDCDLDPLAYASSLRGGDGGQALVFSLLAGLAPLGFVLQAFVVEENLLAGGPNEIVPTVDTLDLFILELHLNAGPGFDLNRTSQNWYEVAGDLRSVLSLETQTVSLLLPCYPWFRCCVAWLSYNLLTLVAETDGFTHGPSNYLGPVHR